MKKILIAIAILLIPTYLFAWSWSGGGGSSTGVNTTYDADSDGFIDADKIDGIVGDNSTASHAIYKDASNAVANQVLAIDAHEGSTTISLIPGICPVIHNSGQADADVSNALPAPVEGACFTAQARSTRSGKYWRLSAAASGTINLDGTTLGRDYVQFTSVAIDEKFACIASGTDHWDCTTMNGTVAVGYLLADLNLSGSSLAFSGEETKSVTVTNAGTRSTTPETSLTTGTHFTISSDTCDGQSIAPAGTCTVSVDSDGAGTFNDTLNIAYNDYPSHAASESPLQVSLSEEEVTANSDSCTGGLLFSWHAENTDVTLGGVAGGVNNGCSVGDTTGTANSGATISTDEHQDGTKSVSIPTASDYYAFDWADDIIKANAGTIDLWIKWTTVVDGPVMFYLNVDVNNRIYIGIDGTSKYIFLYHVAGGTSVHARTNFPVFDAGTWYHVKARWDHSAHSGLYLKITMDTTTGESNSADDGTDAPGTWSGSSGTVNVGDYYGYGGVFFIENLKIYDSWK